MPILEILTIIGAIGSVISGLDAAQSLFSKLWRKIRGKPREEGRFLQRLRDISSDVNQRCKLGVETLGRPFSDGDSANEVEGEDEARNKMMQVVTNLNNKLIGEIENAQITALKASVFCSHLGGVVSELRQETFDCLNKLSRRIRASAPNSLSIPRTLPSSAAITRSSHTDPSDRIPSTYWAPEPAELEWNPHEIGRSSSMAARVDYSTLCEVQLTPIAHIQRSMSSSSSRCNWGPTLSPVSPATFVAPEIDLTPVSASPHSISQFWGNAFELEAISRVSHSNTISSGTSGLANGSDNVLARNLQELETFGT